MNKKNFILFSLILLIFLLQPAGCNKKQQPGLPKADSGLLDLTEYDFNKTGTVKLDGSWEFYWLQFLNRNDFDLKKKSEKKNFFQIPGTWSEKEGFATFKLTVLIRKPGIRYGLRIPGMYSSYKLWIDNKLTALNGITGKTEIDSRAQSLPQTVFFTPHYNKIEIILHVSNYRNSEGGPCNSIILGLENQILLDKEKHHSADIFFFAIFIILGFYHTGLFFLRINSPQTLYFGIFFLLLGFRITLYGEKLFMNLFPLFDWELLIKLEYLTAYLGISLIVVFIRSLYKNEISKILHNVLVASGITFSIITIITSAKFHTQLAVIYYSIILAGCTAIIYGLLTASLKRRKGAVFLTAGFIILFLTGMNDILNYLKIIDSSYTIHIGMTLFLFSQSLVLSLMSSRAFNRVKLLSAQLSEYNHDLEKMVDERTAIITTQKEHLETQILMAQNIQQSLLPKKTPEIFKADIAFKYKPVMGVGGDFIDFLCMGKTRLGIFICDVEGHGVASAFIASMIKMSLNQWEEHLHKPATTLEIVRSSLQGKMGGHFVTAMACYIDLESGEMTAASAGHLPMIVIREKDKLQLIKPSGMLIIDDFKSEFEEYKSILRKGDKLILYTDGLTEAYDNKSMLGENGFLEIVEENRSHNPEKICSNIFKRIEQYSSDDDNTKDDRTIFAMEYK